MNPAVHKRGRKFLSLFLIVCLIAGLFAGLTILSHAANYVYNWGVRDQVCTSLSTAANAYYTGSYTYTRLAGLNASGSVETSNSYSAMQNNSLLTALYDLMSTTQTGPRDLTSSSEYNNLSSLFKYTDCENGDTSGKMRDFWCTDIYMTWNGTYLNREHVWQKSQASFMQINGGCDLHHLRPANAYINQTSHNDKPYGTVSTHNSSTEEYGNVSSGTQPFGGWATSDIYEPPDNAKGDTARIFLFVYVRWLQPNLYSDVSSGNLPTMDSDDSLNTGKKIIESLSTLLTWCKNDPVDTWEMGRNDAIQSIQGNRNVFIDYPELAWYLFGMTPPTDMTTPSGYAANPPQVVTVTATSNNTSYGTVSPATQTATGSCTITASPANGYYAAGYLVTSGTATVTQSGNTFTVEATGNCTVQIVFAPKTTVAISYVANGSSYDPGSAYTTVYSGEAFTLPTAAATVSDWTFVGWTTDSAYQDGTAAPTTYTTYTPTAATTFYAVYQQTAGGGSSDEFTKFTGTIEEGDYLIVAGDDKAMNNTTSSNRLQMTDVSPVNNVITTTNTAIIWHIAPSGSYWTLKNAGNNQYAISTTTKNQLTTGTNSTRGLWTITNSASGATLVNKARTEDANDTANAYLRRNGTYGFACYTSTYGTGPVLYKRESGTTTYSINPGGAAHTHEATLIPAVASTCAVQGHVAYYYCAGCSTYFLDAQCTNPISDLSVTLLPLLDHSYGAYASNNDGTHSRTCSVCGAVDTQSCTYTDVVTPPTAAAQGYTTHTCSVCSYVYVDSYTSLTATEEYIRSDALFDGATVVIYNPSAGVALSSTAKNTYYLKGESVTPTDGILQTSDGTILWTVGKSGDVYTFVQGDKTLMTGKNGSYVNLYTSGSYDSTWNITPIANTTMFDVASATLEGNYGPIFLEYYANGARFCAYSTSRDSNYYDTAQLGMEFYVKHTVLHQQAVAPTCTAAGSLESYTCTDTGCPKYGHFYSDANLTTELQSVTVAATGHNFVNGVCTVCGAVSDASLVYDQVGFSVEGVIKAQFAVYGWNHTNPAYDSYYMIITHHKADGTDETSEPIPMDPNVVSGYTLYVGYYDVYATYMADDLDVTVYGVTNGTATAGPVSTTSVREIAADAIRGALTASTPDQARATVYANMLAYGAQAQIKFSYNTGDLANALTGDDLTRYNASVTTGDPAYAELASTVSTPANMGTEKVTVFTRALSVEERVYLQFGLYFGNYDVDDFTIDLKIGTRSVNVTDDKLVAIDGYPGYYSLIVDSIDAVEGQTPVSFTVYEGTTPVSRTYVDTIENLAAGKSGDDALLSGRLVNFYRAIYALLNP